MSDIVMPPQIKIPDVPRSREKSGRPLGFVHVDLDGLWTLAQAYGFPETDTFTNDPIFTKALPRLLDLFDEMHIAATFFIVGRDLELPVKRDAVLSIAARGHELACHSYNHMIGMERMREKPLREEIERGRDALISLTGKAPLGFRAPGYAAGPRTLAAAADAGFKYDGSFLPVPGWAAWALRRAASGLRKKVARECRRSVDGKPQFKGQYGGATALRKVMKHHRELTKRIRVLPLAVSIKSGLPLHASIGMLLGEGYVKRSLKELAAYKLSYRAKISMKHFGETPVTYLLHGMDAAGPEDFARRLPRCLAKHKGFAAPPKLRLQFLSNALGVFQQNFRVEQTESWPGIL